MKMNFHIYVRVWAGEWCGESLSGHFSFLGGHLKSSHRADKRKNERTFIWEGGGLDPIRCAIDRKKKKQARPSTDRAAALADKSKSPIRCRKSLHDLEQVQAK